MKIPRYRPSGVSFGVQRRILMALLIAMFGTAAAFVSYPFVRKVYFLRRLDDPEPGKRLRALNVVANMAASDAGLRDRVEQELLDGFAAADEQTLPVLVQIGAWTVEHVPTFKERFEARLDTDNDARFAGMVGALREAGEWERPSRCLAQRCRYAVTRCEVREAGLRAAAIHELQHIGPAGAEHLETVIAANLRHESAAVRLAAVRAAAVCLPATAPQSLRGLLDDPDEQIRREARLRLELLMPSRTPTPPANRATVNDLIAALRSSDYFGQLQAIAEMSSRSDLTADQTDQVRDALRDAARSGLSSGNGGLAGSALQGLAAQGDSSYLPVMLDVAATFGDQPMLRYLAARAAARLDALAGGQALINLFSQSSDVVRDLAAISVSRLEEPALRARLVLELYSPELDMRGPSAWALALADRGALQVHDMTLRELLDRRTTLLKNNVHAEAEWKPRGYYLCSRLVLGDRSVREELEVFELNANFPRLAIYVSLLHTGEMSVVDLLLGTEGVSNQRRMTILRDWRLADILPLYVPDAPALRWSERLDQRQAQLDRLTAWWSIYRWRVRFEPQRRQYVIAD